jgi:hypothetical protein
MGVDLAREISTFLMMVSSAPRAAEPGLLFLPPQDRWQPSDQFQDLFRQACIVSFNIRRQVGLGCQPLSVNHRLLNAEMMIRPALPADAEAIARIYNYYILNTVITFEEQVVAPQAIVERLHEVEICCIALAGRRVVWRCRRLCLRLQMEGTLCLPLLG